MLRFSDRYSYTTPPSVLITEDMPQEVENVYGRRYFYPLITDFEPYKDIPSAHPANLPVANKIANQVICLPMHHALSEDDVKRVIDNII